MIKEMIGSKYLMKKMINFYIKKDVKEIGEFNYSFSICINENKNQLQLLVNSRIQIFNNELIFINQI